MAYTFDIDAFRVSFPAFADEELFPDDTLQMYWDNGTCIIANCGSGPETDCRYRMLALMAAHLAALSVLIAGGEVPGLAQSASVDKVAISLTPPPLDTQFEWWLNLTAYGQQLLIVLQISVAGGFYVGGGCERAAFRKAGGYF